VMKMIPSYKVIQKFVRPIQVRVRPGARNLAENIGLNC